MARSEAAGDLELLQSSLFLSCTVNHVVVMLTSLHLHKKSKEVCIKTRSPAAASSHKPGYSVITVKWSIRLDYQPLFGK